MKLHCTFSIDAAHPKGYDTYSCEWNRYYFSGFAVPLQIVPDMHSQPAREMKLNLKERFGIFVKKKNSTHGGAPTLNL